MKTENVNWIKLWEGKWSLLSCLYFGYLYTKRLEEILGCHLENYFVSCRKGHSAGYAPKEEVAVFGKKLAVKVAENEKMISQ